MLVNGIYIIALVNDIQDEQSMFIQISFGDKLIVDDMLEEENKCNGKGTSGVGSYAKLIFIENQS